MSRLLQTETFWDTEALQDSRYFHILELLVWKDMIDLHTLKQLRFTCKYMLNLIQPIINMRTLGRKYLNKWMLRCSKNPATTRPVDYNLFANDILFRENNKMTLCEPTHALNNVILFSSEPVSFTYYLTFNNLCYDSRFIGKSEFTKITNSQFLIDLKLSTRINPIVMNLGLRLVFLVDSEKNAKDIFEYSIISRRKLPTEPFGFVNIIPQKKRFATNIMSKKEVFGANFNVMHDQILQYLMQYYENEEGDENEENENEENENENEENQDGEPEHIEVIVWM